MSVQTVLADLAEGMALGFAEQIVDHLKAASAGHGVNRHARSVGQQLASSLLDHSPDSTSIDTVILGQPLPMPAVASGQQLIAARHAVWNHHQQPTPELLRAMADYQEGVDRGRLD